MDNWSVKANAVGRASSGRRRTEWRKQKKKMILASHPAVKAFAPAVVVPLMPCKRVCEPLSNKKKGEENKN
jgi:hypothetical protein